MDLKNQTFNCGKFIFNIGRRAFTCTKRLIKGAWKVLFVFIMFCFRRRDSGESVPITMPCEECKKHEKKIKELEDSLQQTLKKIDTQQGTMNYYRSENARLKQENDEIKERSDNITSEMASILETKGDLENVNDEFANTKLAKMFEALYDNKWTALSEWLDMNNPDLMEFKRIKGLTLLSKNAYEECVRLAEVQLRHFLLLDEDDEITSAKDIPELLKIRRMSGQHKRTRNKVKKEVMGKILGADSTQDFCLEENRKETIEQLEGFFNEYIDCCWLMTISHPKLILKFDVVGRPYSGFVKERFKQYSCQEEVKSASMEKDTVFEVVWPSVELEDGAGIYAKGDVITVDKGKET